MCSPKFVLEFINVKDSHNYFYISQVFISGYGELCLTEYHQLMQIYADNSYDLHIDLSNLLFYNITQQALNIEMKYTDASILFKNCTFAYSMNEVDIIDSIIFSQISTSNAYIKFEDYAFHYNVVFLLLFLKFNHDGLCAHPSNITIDNCNFIGNNGDNVMLLYGIYLIVNQISFSMRL